MDMIEETNCWVWSNNPNNKLVEESSKGKWIITGSLTYMRRVFPKVDTLVEQGKIYGAKYSHKKNLPLEPLPYNKPVMCVFADDQTKDTTLEELLKIGIKPSEWKYGYETKEDWKPGGKLYEESQLQRTVFLLEALQNKD